MEQGMSHIEQDHIQIKSFIASAWACAFEEAAKMQNRLQIQGMLKPYFQPCMTAMINVLFSKEAVSSGTVMSFSTSVNDMLEKCDG